MKTGIELIAEERQEQIEKHGYDIDWVKYNPIYYDKGQFLQAACLLMVVGEMLITPLDYPTNWPYEDCEKMISKSPIERLAVAGALIAAEIDRLQNQ